MKIQNLIILFLLSVGASYGQNNSGIITYEDKFNVHKSLPEEMADFKDRIPEFRATKKVLVFSGQEGFYSTKKKEAGEISEETNREFRGEGHGMRMRFGGRGGNNNNEFYTNIKESTSIDKRDFFGKEFLIEGERVPLKWKITADQKQVGSYLCQKAVYQDSTQNLVAWFTPMIPVSTGPDDYFGLPGLILHIDIDDGSRTITATEIQLQALEEGVIVKPTKGKKVTQDEFDKIREEKMEEMKQENGGRQGRYMITRGR